jgi:hypothetical protein
VRLTAVERDEAAGYIVVDSPTVEDDDQSIEGGTIMVRTMTMARMMAAEDSGPLDLEALEKTDDPL